MSDAPERQGLVVGDRVRIGKGKKEYIVKDFLGALSDDHVLVELEPVNGYTSASATPDRLTRVESLSDADLHDELLTYDGW